MKETEKPTEGSYGCLLTAMCVLTSFMSSFQVNRGNKNILVIWGRENRLVGGLRKSRRLARPQPNHGDLAVISVTTCQWTVLQSKN